MIYVEFKTVSLFSDSVGWMSRKACHEWFWPRHLLHSERGYWFSGPVG